MLKRITITTLISVALLLILWDIVVAISPDKGDTISEVIYHTAARWLGLAFSAGGLMGHFFLPRKRMPSDPVYWGGFTFLLSVAIGFFIFPEVADVLFFQRTTLAFIGGFLAGAALWPQKRIR